MLEETRTSENQALSFARQATEVDATDAVHAVPAIVARYLTESTSEATRRGYDADLRKFFEWGGSVPATADTVALYLAEHAETLTSATLSRRLAAISKAHAVRGLPSPTSHPLVHQTLRGIRRTHRRPQRQVTPLLEADMRAIVGTVGNDLRGLRDKALLLLGYATACRRSELVALEVEDVAHSTVGMVITIKSSKTDPFAKGRKVAIARRPDDLCAVTALQCWLRVASIEAGHVFRAVDCHGNVSATGLSAQTVGLVVKAHAERVGFDPKRFAGHSLRSGAITSAVLAGQPAWRVKLVSGHRCDAVFSSYVRTSEPAQLSVGERNGQ
ncbi:MAG: tyrosine-type recombinase/integrase [Rhizobiaceae bacterium]|nr:tyrosine-type recombinase/integrase [Rhizobiaceae bacterium]